ncbi:hypothetical protein NFI96_016237 [Prochilodus magdalenae]|nr:hypothetical protein NFI96_016237 [Prochilodus magdalenae]
MSTARAVLLWWVSDGLGRPSISLEGRTDLYRLDNGTLTAIRYQDEILEPSDPTLVQWVLGSSWCMAVPGLMWREYAGSS